MKVHCYISIAVAVLLSSCGYHLGGTKAPTLQGMNTFCVEMFANETEYPNAGVLMTSAVANTLQGDGTYRMATCSEADFVVKGKVKKIQRHSMITNTDDSYTSTQVGVTVYVDYQIVDLKNGRTLISAKEEGNGDFFTEVGNAQSSFEAAVSYATRRIADDITVNLVAQ